MHEQSEAQELTPISAEEMANSLIASYGSDAPIFAAGQLIWQAIVANQTGVQEMKQVIAILAEVFRVPTQQESIH